MDSQLRLTVVLGFGIPYNTLPDSYCAYFWCATSPTLSGISTLYPGRGSQLFGLSDQTDSGIRIWHSLYTLPEVIVPTSGVQLSNTFRYFYS